MTGNPRPNRWNSLFSLASQSINTLTNIALAAMVAHVTTPGQFGAWALVMVGFGLALQVSRALVVTPILVHEAVVERVPRWLSNQGCSSALLIGIFSGGAIVGVAFLLPPEVLGSGVVVAIALPFILVQDLLRNEAIRNRRGQWALLLDVAWAAIQGAGVAAVLMFGSRTATSLTVAWALGGALAGFGAMVITRRQFGWAAARRFASENREARVKLLLESVLGNGVLLALPAMLAIVAGLTVAGAVRASQTVFGPITFLMGGLIPLITTASVYRTKAGRGSARLIIAASLATAGLSLMVSLIVVIWPDIGHLLAGNSWPLVHTVLIPFAIAAGLRGSIGSIPAVMRSRRLFNEVVVLRLQTALPTVVLPLASAAVWGLQGAGWGIAAAGVVNALQSVLCLRRLTGSPQHRATTKRGMIRGDETETAVG